MKTLWQVNARDSAVSDVILRLVAEQVPFGYTHYEHVDESPGLYCFWVRGTCLYVGMSTNLKKRLHSHCVAENNPILKEHFISYRNEIQLSLAYISVSVDKLCEFERQVISKLRPIANRRGNK